MELHKLEVPHLRTGSVSHGDTVTRRHWRIRCLPIDMACPSRRDDDRLGGNCTDLSRGSQNPDACNTFDFCRSVLENEINGHV